MPPDPRAFRRPVLGLPLTNLRGTLDLTRPEASSARTVAAYKHSLQQVTACLPPSAGERGKVVPGDLTLSPGLIPHISESTNGELVSAQSISWCVNSIH